MSNDLTKYPGGSLDIGVDAYKSDFYPELELDIDSFNLSSGIHRGIGPRFGMAPIPGQQDSEVPTGTQTNSMRYAETVTPGTTSRGLASRTKVFGIVPLRVRKYDDYRQIVTTYAWIVGVSDGGSEYIGLCFSSSYAAGPVFSHTADLRDGLSYDQVIRQGNLVDSYGYMPLYTLISGRAPALVSNSKLLFMYSLLSISDLPCYSRGYVSVASISVSGRDVPMEWYFGSNLNSPGDATHAPNLNFWINDDITAGALGGLTIVNCGVPSFYEIGNFKKKERLIESYAVDSSGNLNIYYRVSLTPTSTIFKGQPNYDTANGEFHFDGSGVTWTKVTAGTSYGNTKGALLRDSDGFTNSAYKAILAAPNKATCFILQDWLRSADGTMTQACDLTSLSYEPQTIASANYTENGASVPVCFRYFPGFVRGTALSAGGGVSLSAANTGILRQNTVYEFTFSYYNKRLNFESNVGKPVKFQTNNADDYVALQLWQPNGANVTPSATLINLTPGESAVPFSFGTDSSTLINFLSAIELNNTEYRFYYRKEGSFEWLPALFIDAAKYWFYPYHAPSGAPTQGLRACTAPIAALPGGQPGGFIDYSPLADQAYTHVLTYKNRVWWFSENAINFSLPNNIFAYPTRNSIAAPTGSFKGGIVHNYPGQAEQSSRLVIFGTDEVYVARFTGDLATAPVQVSDNTIGEYPVDASDLVIDPWTSNTAFSHRAAVIADGILFWWGPGGIFRDDGVNTPRKISLGLEPNIFTLFDPSDTDNIHAAYDANAKEITWFYKPKTADSYATHAMTYNVVDEQFYPQRFEGAIDHVFPLKVDTDMPTAGKRQVAVVRESRATEIQRAYFYDIRNRAGDLRPETEMMVKTVATPVAGRRRLTLAAGYDATNFATIAAGDLVTLQQVKQYASTLTDGDDMLATVAAVNTGSGYLDIILPDGVDFDAAASLTKPYYFPIWHRTKTAKGLNGIPWQIKTNYWMPGGLNQFTFFQWLYILHKLNKLPSSVAQTYQIGYRSPQSDDFITDTVTYDDNSDGYWQLYHQLRVGNLNAQGQALKLLLSGIQSGSELVLQFLELQGNDEMGNLLKQFEG